MREVAQRYIPSMKVDTIFMGDRLGRGGDHTPFQWEGFAAVRISTPNEIYANQHHATDLLEHMSVPYTTKVAKVNAAVAASLALAPKPPLVHAGAAGQAADGRAQRPGHRRRCCRRAGRGGAGAAGRRPGPMIARGGGYDAVLQWRAAGPEDGHQGLLRS